MATAITHQITKELNAGGLSYRGSKTISASSEPDIAVDIAADQTDLEFTLGIINANLKSLFMLASVNMTIYTNAASGGAPDDEIHLAAGEAYEWSLTGSYIGEAAASPLSANVTSIFVTNTTPGSLVIKALVDPLA